MEYNFDMLINEEWTRIPDVLDDLAQYYYISTFGRIYSAYSKKILSTSVNAKGYEVVTLSLKNGKRITRRVNRLVMISFCYFVGCENYIVNHKNGDTLFNHLINLEWGTHSYNTNHAIATGLQHNTFIGQDNPHAKINESIAYEIYNLLISGLYTDIEIAQMTNSTPAIVRLIANGKSWTFLFTDEQREQMARTRYGNILSESQMHSICLYFQNNIGRFSGYGAVTALVKEAIAFIGLELTDQLIRKVKRLYYRRDNPEITNLYNY